MALIKAVNAQETYVKEGEYVSEFLRWKGLVDKVPMMMSILNANADAVTASWRTEGENGKTMAGILDNFEGNGKETFKLMMNNMVKIAKIGGDAYAEIIFDGDNVDDMFILPPSDIKQVIKNGRIKRYEQVSEPDVKWKPKEILHFAYNPVGSSTHGESVIKRMNNILLHLLQVQDDMAKLYHRYVKPVMLFQFNTDSQTEIDKFMTKWNQTVKVMDSDIGLPEQIVKVDRASIPQFSTLDPAVWHRLLVDQLIMSSRVPELALGTGSVNSEESARMQSMGFLQMVRFDQQFMEDGLQRQLFFQQYPEQTPSIKFSFASEAQDERYKRVENTLSVISQLELDPQLKELIKIKLLQDMKLIPNA